MCLRWCTTDENDHTAVVEQDQSNGTKQGVCGRFREESFRAIHSVVRVVRDIYRIPPQSRPRLAGIIASTEIDSIDMIF